ncbi:uncharacterized protein LOC128257957 [Drosophila gunungcola]|uniref:uncharacterized protein LOC128257957 n=1 Tax=Drosophila gunungcola TaxID=103775 RepID=UPI0022E39518|nr:uncharacterized protein LOC128257957 [Drosophila gunungcola]
MCNLNQVSGDLQKSHFSCCRQKMHYGDKSKEMVGTDRQHKLKETDQKVCGLYCPLNWLLKCPLHEETSRIESKSNSKCSKASSLKGNSLLGKVLPRTSSTVKKMSEARPIQTRPSKKCYIRTSLTSQGKPRNKGFSTSEGEGLLSATNSNCCARTTMTLYPRKKNLTPLEGNKRKQASKPEVEQNQKALVKVKPKAKRKKTKGNKILGRSTAGDDDDDCVWYECNLPFRVNIPFPISMKNNFQPLAGNSNPDLFKSLVPSPKLHQDSSIPMPWPSEFLMQRALPAPNPEDSSSFSKAKAYTKKKGLKRGRKLCTFETSYSND